jgi:peptide/nickel transport system permease protein
MRFLAFLVRRIGAALFTFVCLILIAFVVYWALPSTPAFFLYPGQIHLTDYQIAHANHLFALDRPKYVQVGNFFWRLVHGDIGKSWRGSQFVTNDQLNRSPLGPQVYPALRITLSIILGGALLVVLFAIPLGAYAGSHIGTIGDRAISVGTLVGVCTHPMVLGSLLAMYLGWGHLHLLPAGSYCPFEKGPQDFCGGPKDWALHLALPWVTFALIFLALYTRMIRSSVADTLHEEFVRTARAKGAGELRVMRSHVLPPASMRVLTMVGMEVGTAIGVCIYIEAAFNMQGLGQVAVFAMGGASGPIDLPLTLAVVTLITAIVVIGNLVVDVLYAVVDPRATRETARGRAKSLVGGVF